MRAYERLLNYVKIYTTSEEEGGATPSAAREFDLGNVLTEELKEIGVENVRITKNCYVYGEITSSSRLFPILSQRKWLLQHTKEQHTGVWLLLQSKTRRWQEFQHNVFRQPVYLLPQRMNHRHQDRKAGIV